MNSHLPRGVIENTSPIAEEIKRSYQYAYDCFLNLGYKSEEATNSLNRIWAESHTLPAEIWAIIREVAKVQPVLWDGHDWYQCPFCSGGYYTCSSKEVEHDADCLALKAQNLLKETGQE